MNDVLLEKVAKQLDEGGAFPADILRLREFYHQQNNKITALEQDLRSRIKTSPQLKDHQDSASVVLEGMQFIFNVPKPIFRCKCGKVIFQLFLFNFLVMSHNLFLNRIYKSKRIKYLV